MMKLNILFICISILFTQCSKKGINNDSTPVASIATVSDIDQQSVKGWGCCPVWIGNHDISTQPLTQQATFELGATIIRLSQLPETGDSNGNINQYAADELCRAILITSNNGFPYILSNWSPPAGMKTISADGSVSNDTLAYLKTTREQMFCDFVVKLMNYISITKGLPLPVTYSLQNEPTCQTPWAGCIYDSGQYKRVTKLLRASLDAAGYSGIKLLGSEDGGYNNGQGWNSSVYLLGGNGFPSLNDSAFNNAIGAFASHSYDWHPNTTIDNYNKWIDGCDFWEKDRWQTEYCYIEDSISPHAIGTVRRFISDMAYLKNNYWFTWTVNEGYGHDVPDALCFGDGINSLTRKPAYYVLKKLFTSIPTGSRIRRMTTTDNELISDNAGKMDMVAFASDTNMVVVIVNPTPSVKKTNVNGLTGSSAHVYQLASKTNNTDMQLISSPVISGGIISNINLPANSVTIVVTSGLKFSKSF
jgi:large repetitive protein